jgi:hypothetical protein
MSRIREAIPPLPILLHGVMLNEAQELLPFDILHLFSEQAVVAIFGFRSGSIPVESLQALSATWKFFVILFSNSV